MALYIYINARVHAHVCTHIYIGTPYTFLSEHIGVMKVRKVSDNAHIHTVQRRVVVANINND
jgi:hypothetical protein